MKLQGRVALVTGSSRGIGAAIAERLARDGARVVLHARANGERAERVAQDIRTAGGTAHVLAGDLGHRDTPARLVRDAFAIHGALDILVNNAGVMIPSPVDASDPDVIDRDLAVNLRAVILATVAFAECTTSSNGRIVNISSISGKHASYGHAVYAASKAGVVAYTRSVAQELGPRGITVNAVAPGVTIPAGAEQAEQVRDFTRLISSWGALRRVGRPEDIADIVAFLASDDARWLTGTTLDANGGAVAGGGTIGRYMQQLAGA
jgi:3-oxoacyl-[acyl-carrier protein] reductase